MTSSAVLSLADVTSETVAGLWTKIYSNLRTAEVGRGMLVCKSFLGFLPPLIKSIDWTYPPLDQKTFERFAKTYRNLEQLSIEQEYDDDLPMLDWSKVSFPHLTYLSLSCSPAKSFEFDMRNTPVLRQLSVSHQGPDSAAKFKLELPHLETLFFEHCHVSSTESTCRSHLCRYHVQL